MHRLLAIVLGAALAVPVLAAEPDLPAPQAQCAMLAKLSYPAADMPNATQKAALKNCNVTKLYYGIGQRQDAVKARQCAFMPDTEDDVFVARKGVLMMVYANGEGVARDLSLAKKAACEAGGAPAELDGRLAHLRALAANPDNKTARIDYCDDVTSGLMGGYCSSVQTGLRDAERERALTALTRSWKPNERAALQRLRQAAEAFIDARGSGEVDLSGTARASMVLNEEKRQRDAFFASLKAFEAGKLPRSGSAAYAARDRELNAVYQQLKRLPESQFTTVKMADIQATQRLWLRYRDAWVEFGKLRYPSVPADAWRAYFTQQRTVMLKSLLSGRE